MFFGGGYWCFIILCLLICISYFAGLALNMSCRIHMRKTILCVSVIFILVVLLSTKYLKFIFRIFGITCDGLNEMSILRDIPIGISFFSLQIIGYLFDVYRNKFIAERDFTKYAAFVSFFPTIISGPITRADDILPEFDNIENNDLSDDDISKGFLLLLWGMFQKMVIADRIAIYVDSVYASYNTVKPVILFIAVLLYGLEIYTDFSGYSDMVIGMSQIMGIHLKPNFRQPYFSQNISEFWGKWHISLSSWLRDYIYIPLGGNKRGKVIQYKNLMITFLVSGLWHGASWNYVIWGGLHGLYSITQKCLNLIKIKSDILSLKVVNETIKIIKCFITFVVVDFAWIFFRATGGKEAIEIISILLDSYRMLFGIEDLFLYGLNKSNFILLFITLILLIIVDFFRTKVDLTKKILELNVFSRWMIYYSLIFALFIFGIYGPGYDANAFVYQQF